MISMIKEEKQKLREKIWKKMTDENIARFPLPCRDRIPNFEGSEVAAEKVRDLPEWESAKVIASNPDFAQREVRRFALEDGKVLIMASPRLKRNYLLIDPKNVKGKEDFASTIKGAFKFGKELDVKDFPKPDLIIKGSVAVDKHGNRLGKGGGYGDKESARIKEEFGEMPVVTTVHDSQVVDFVPTVEHDQKVDIIITPKKIIRCNNPI